MNDEDYMKLAIDLSSKAYYPYGAIIVKNNKIIGRSDTNTCISKSKFSHAELRAIESCIQELGGHLCAEEGSGVTIYTSCEPCAMCMGAILYTGIERLVYGATLEDSKECVNEIIAHSKEIASICQNRKIEIISEYMRDDAKKILTEWKRKQNNNK